MVRFSMMFLYLVDSCSGFSPGNGGLQIIVYPYLHVSSYKESQSYVSIPFYFLILQRTV